jgi:hypothetical protein
MNGAEGDAGQRDCLSVYVTSGRLALDTEITC